ncbi:hypothetical protein [Microseira wollei]|uniref:Uncharacterized protein n=1 Tax=Microseira wollei NIES-4236 TaxID=2530354 RepID=A0AAV3XUG1_9CYAN|nr:hypothetical protein [Microseira wollei]GET44172.1 hypothetical protein MiSe_89980 [Microseira wollei NIES-4236]
MTLIPLTGSFQTLLTARTQNAQVQCFSARTVFNQIQSQIFDDYYTFVQLFIESFDIAANITSLNQAPLPNINDLDSRTEPATKIYNNWINSEKVAIQLLYDDGGGLFRKQGQPIILPNIPFQLPIQHLRPYLSATQEVLLVGESDRIGVQVLSDSGYQQLASSDEILIKGQWKAEVKLIEKKSQSIDNWYPIGVDLPANEAKIIRPFNQKRRALYIVNAGTTNVRFFYGHISQVLLDTCPYLVPNGTFNQETWGNYAIAQQLVALSVGGNGRLVGMEGSI